MKKDFLKPALIFALAAILAGLLAWVIPAYQNDLFPIRKMTWFSALAEPAAEDSIPSLPEPKHYQQQALMPFLEKLSSMPTLAGQMGIISSTPDSGRVVPSGQHLRIAYFSDSIIEGDLITAPIRYALQQNYGGHGVGMVPITSIVSGFRQTIRHSFSRNWESISFTDTHKNHISLGITGYTFIPRPYYTEAKTIDAGAADSLFLADSLFFEAEQDTLVDDDDDGLIRYYVDEDPWVEYRTVDIAGGSDSFRRIRLFYSHASDSSFVRIFHDSNEPTQRRLIASHHLQILDISPASPTKKLRLEFPKDDPIHVYGVSFDDKKGAYVDNFPSRGYSGLYFQRIHSGLLKDFITALNYDLIILQYGGNITHPDNTDYSGYRSALIRTIRHIQSSAIDVPILIAGMHDRAVRIGTQFQSSPDLPLLISAQSEAAEETDAAFWNVYAAMGGRNSMLDFVNQNPPLAGRDYTHFTRRGADRIAELFLDFLAFESTAPQKEH